MLIIDAHQDIAYNAVTAQRDYLRPVAETRALEGAHAEDVATVGLPDALAAGVGVVFGTLFAIPASAGLSSEVVGYRTADEAHAQALDQLAVYRRLAEHPQITLITTRQDLAAIEATWEGERPVQGIVLLMEGADPVRIPGDAAEWQAAGIRIIGPAWGATRYASGTGAPGPLTAAGRDLIREMSRIGLALDISHLAEESFWEALDLCNAPLLASHSNCRALVPGPRADRHLSDAMIRALIEHDGVIGIALYNAFLDSAWTREHSKSEVGLDLVVRHIDHICQLAGDARHVAIGSDFDGGFGSACIPRELDSVADLPLLAMALRTAGFAEDDVKAVMGGNWKRKLAQILK